ncbi:putative luciferase-like oxidoreductase [Mycobacteroides abscessus subsp. abscessus]|nr:putative luciferase-like oxidoreductase [Mycobacteroides abscessus subsp. abscessus]
MNRSWECLGNIIGLRSVYVVMTHHVQFGLDTFADVPAGMTNPEAIRAVVEASRPSTVSPMGEPNWCSAVDRSLIPSRCSATT